MAPKNAHKYYCDKCDFKCCKTSDWTRHKLTRKHQNRTNLNDFTPITPKDYICCKCNKSFNARNSLWYHKQKCNRTYYQSEDMESEIPINPNITVVMDLLKQNQELQKQLIDAVKVNGPSIQNNTINNNQKFNLNFFLNEQCKDAINMSEFIENMKLNTEDLTETGRLGYVDGIARILVNKLQELDIYQRPLHCTDMKRETLYIKENDEWEKQVNSKEKLTHLVNKVANKNCQNLKLWVDEHPTSQVFDSPENMEYVRLTQAVLGGFGDYECKQYREKIIKSVIKEVMVNKI